jgi:two-component system, chemotaxis family, sensor kinase CheA
VEGLAEIVAQFLMESHDDLERVERDLDALDRDAGARDRVFRTVHTIKGTAGFLAFTRLEALAHAGESLLARLRDGVQPVTPDAVAALRATVGGVRALLAAIERHGSEGDVAVDAILGAVHAQLNAPAAEPPERAQPRRPAPEPVQGQRRPLGEMLVASGAAAPADVGSALQRQLEGDHRKLGTILLEEGKAAPAAVLDALHAQAPGRRAGGGGVGVDAGLLDSLTAIVGELVLARNQLVHGVLETGDPALARSAQRLGALTGELQEAVTRARMQPIEQIWSALPAVVRDLSGSLGKQVGLVLHGTETELDRGLLEALREPLTRLVRDAVERGIEEPASRVAVGKPPEGTLTLRAYHEGNHVALEVADDGAGLDVDRGLRQGVEHGVERIGGTVTVDSAPGEGTAWRLTIPLTLAVIQALTVECADQRYVVPQVAVQELVFIDGRSTRIEHVAGAPVYRLRGAPLPLVRLDRAVGLDPGGEHGVYVMVLQAEGRRFGLVVDRVLDTEEVVVKAPHGGDAGLYDGATILGDGKVGLILDVPALARRSRLGADPRPPGAPSRAAAPGERFLVAAVGERRVAIPLDATARLEEFPAGRVEASTAGEAVRYGDRTLPLVRLSDLLGGPRAEAAGDTLSVVVYAEGGRSAALLVDRVVEVVENPAGGDDALVGTAVLRQRVAELLDVRRAILAADPDPSREPADDELVAR